METCCATNYESIWLFPYLSTYVVQLRVFVKLCLISTSKEIARHKRICFSKSGLSLARKVFEGGLIQLEEKVHRLKGMLFIIIIVMKNKHL